MNLNSPAMIDINNQPVGKHIMTTYNICGYVFSAIVGKNNEQLCSRKLYFICGV